MVVRLRVKEVAKEKGFSMGKLQRDADVAYNTVKRIFKDPYYITTTETLGKLARALGVSPGELIEEVSDLLNLDNNMLGEMYFWDENESRCHLF
jgi:DNA-binding Xre family transcriptional regulator